MAVGLLNARQTALQWFVPCGRFPKDEATYTLDKQFLWGRVLLVTPVLEPGADSVIGYFPKGVWYDYYTVRAQPLSSCHGPSSLESRRTPFLRLPGDPPPPRD